MRTPSAALTLFLALALAVAARAEPYFSSEEAPQATRVGRTTLLSGLEHPWSMAWLPDGGLLITERPGRVTLYRHGRGVHVSGAPKVLASGQGGLLDISLHPRFAENRLVYMTIAEGTENANRTALVRAEFDGRGFGPAETLFRATPDKTGGQHFGSRMAWLPDGTLVLSVGDGGNPPRRVNGVLSRDMAQVRSAHLGKLVRLNDDGTPASPPAFAGDAAPGLHTMGHRNIQGLAWDPLRRTLWASEHGARGGDEINRIEPGANYGWPEASHSREYVLPKDVSAHRSLPGMVDPVVVWEWRFAPSGLLVYTGDAFPDWKGDLLAGGLRSRIIRIIELDPDGNPTGEKGIAMEDRVRDIRQGPDGLIYVLTDEGDGRLVRLEPR